MSDAHQPWEPDPAKLGKNWTSMFEGPPKRPSAEQGQARPAAPAYDDADLSSSDASEYKPWTLQRGAGRPVLMIDFRRYEPKSGLWTGWQLAYAHLIAVEYIGDRMVSLEFATRQLVIEGRGLDELARHLQQGSVTAVHEHAPQLWATVVDGAVISAIRTITGQG